MGRRIKRLTDLEFDEVSTVDRPANQHGIVAIAKSQESVMSPIYDADGDEVAEEELEHGDFVYDDDGNEFVFLDSVPDESYEEEFESVGKAWGSGMRTNVRNAFGHAAEQARAQSPTHTSTRLTPQGRGAGTGNWAGRNYANADAKVRGAGSSARNKFHDTTDDAGIKGKAAWAGAKKRAGQTNYRVGAGGVAVAGAGGGGAYATRDKWSGGKSLGDEVMESLSKSLTDSDRNEVIAKAMDYVESVSSRNEELENTVYSMIQGQDAEGYYELAKSYDIPADPDEIANLMYRASQVLPDEDLQTLDRIFTATGEFSKAYYDEIGYSGGYEGSALGEVFAAAGQVVSKSGAALTQEQAVTALFDANPAAYDEYEAEQRYNR